MFGKGHIEVSFCSEVALGPFQADFTLDVLASLCSISFHISFSKGASTCPCHHCYLC